MSTIDQAHPNRQALSPFFILALICTIALVIVASVVAFL